jgi:hypothetical protein
MESMSETYTGEQVMEMLNAYKNLRDAVGNSNFDTLNLQNCGYVGGAIKNYFEKVPKIFRRDLADSEFSGERLGLFLVRINNIKSREKEV